MLESGLDLLVHVLLKDFVALFVATFDPGGLFGVQSFVKGNLEVLLLLKHGFIYIYIYIYIYISIYNLFYRMS